MGKSGLGSAAVREVQDRLAAGAKRADILEELHAKYYDRDGLARLIASTPAQGRVAAYAERNAILFWVLCLLAGFTLLVFSFLLSFCAQGL